MEIDERERLPSEPKTTFFLKLLLVIGWLLEFKELENPSLGL